MTTTFLSDHGLELRVLATLGDVSQLDVAEAKTAAERSRLTTEDFHSPLHQRIWKAQCGLLFDGEACDLFRASTRMPAADREATMKLMEGTGMSMLTAASIYGAADDLRGLTLRRNILRFGRELSEQAASSSDPATLLTNATAMLSRITTSRAATWRTLAEVLELTRREMLEIAEGKGSPVIPTGLKEWDRLLGGLWPTLTILAAHSGSGKSGLIARIVLNLAMAGVKVAIFSLEDHATWLAYRALASTSGLAQFILRNRKLTDAQAQMVHHGEQELHGYAGNILIDDRGRLPSTEIVQSARDAILNRGARALIVDHYGEVTHEGGGDRHDLMIATGLSELRNLAKGYGVPIVVAAHLKPGAEYPFSVHSLANSAAFERMARVLVAWEKRGDVLKAIILKNTSGIVGPFELPFDGPSAMVTNAVEQTPPKQEPLL